MHADASAPPPTWTNRRSRLRPAEPRGDLVADRLAALDGQAVLVPLAGEGKLAGGDGPLQRVVRGVARHAGLPLTHRECRPQLLQPRHDLLVGPRRDEHVQRPPAGPGHDPGRQRCVPAAGDGQSSGRRVAGQAEPFDDLQMDQQPEEMPGLVRTRDVPGLVLHPHVEPQPRRKVVDQFERRDLEPHARRRPRPRRPAAGRARRTPGRTSRSPWPGGRSGRACGTERTGSPNHR